MPSPNNTPTTSPAPPNNGPQWDPFTTGETVTISSDTTFSQYLSQVSAAKRGKKLNIKSNYDPTLSLEANKGFTFGCDPEGFLFDRKTGRPVPAAGILKGTKWEPFKVDKGAYQVDGLAAEFNIDPVSTYREWEDNITTVIAQLEAAIPAELELKWVPSVEFAPEEFDKAPDESKILGCDPDVDAYSGGVNPPPMLENPYLRVAGGHIHFGFAENEDLSDIQHLINCQDVGKQADWFLGAWSVSKDPDLIRRKLYGKMGSIRYKPYGVEYRVLSNFWVPDKTLRLEVWNRMVSTVNGIGNYFLPERAPRNLQDDLERSINDHVTSQDLAHYAMYPIQTLDENYVRL